jgi:NAD(P)-dependent dehydrogenase (short-subunit alcohol dehydrogenase family)
VGRTMLVTGAGGGIGHALAKRLLARGDHVIAAARRLDQVADLAAAGATCVAMDVGDDASVRAGFAGLSTLDAVVNCAAVAPAGTVEFTAPEQVAQVVNVNTLGALRVLQGALPLLRESGSGRLVLVSSLWGEVSGPFVSSYAASKHAIEALADSARRETIGQGVHISVVQPGVVKTPMYTNQLGDLDAAITALGPAEATVYGALYRDHRKVLASAGKGAITAEQCCAAIEKCLDARRPRPRYRVGTDARLMVGLGHLLSDRMLDRVFGAIYHAPRRRTG